MVSDLQPSSVLSSTNVHHHDDLHGHRQHSRHRDRGHSRRPNGYNERSGGDGDTDGDTTDDDHDDSRDGENQAGYNNGGHGDKNDNRYCDKRRPNW